MILSSRKLRRIVEQKIWCTHMWTRTRTHRHNYVHTCFVFIKIVHRDNIAVCQQNRDSLNTFAGISFLFFESLQAHSYTHKLCERERDTNLSLFLLRYTQLIYSKFAWNTHIWFWTFSSASATSMIQFQYLTYLSSVYFCHLSYLCHTNKNPFHWIYPKLDRIVSHNNSLYTVFHQSEIVSSTFCLIWPNQKRLHKLCKW